MNRRTTIPEAIGRAFPEHEFKIMLLDADQIIGEYSRYWLNTDHYLFIYVVDGGGSFDLDFTELPIHAGQALIVAPGQVYRVAKATPGTKGWIIKFPAPAVSDTGIANLSQLIIDNSAITPTEAESSELEKIFSMLRGRNEVTASEEITRLMAHTFGSVLIEALLSRNEREHADRLAFLPTLVTLHRLFDTDIRTSRLPSHYARLMGVNAVSFNRTFKSVMGMPISIYIRNYSMLLAKRLLVLTSYSVRHIAESTGYDDPAYFNRLFKRMNGVSPKQFRQTHTI